MTLAACGLLVLLAIVAVFNGLRRPGRWSSMVAGFVSVLAIAGAWAALALSRPRPMAADEAAALPITQTITPSPPRRGAGMDAPVPFVRYTRDPMDRDWCPIQLGWPWRYRESSVTNGIRPSSREAWLEPLPERPVTPPLAVPESARRQLEDVHNANVRLFNSLTGFGRDRIFLNDLRSPEIVIPEERCEIAADAAVNRQDVTASHGTRATLETTSSAPIHKRDESVEEGRYTRWVSDRVQLVSLLMHDDPCVYEMTSTPPPGERSFGVPREEDDSTRPLDSFEQGSLVRLQKGEDIVIGADADSIRVFGAVRAATDCLNCHSVRAGALLGVFSYRLVPYCVIDTSKYPAQYKEAAAQK